MSDATPEPTAPPPDRVTELEILLTHLQEDFHKLNDAVLGQQRQIETLTKSLDRLGHKVDKLGDEPETRDPAQERPPHY